MSEMWLKMSRGLRVKYPLFLSNFNDTWIFSTDLKKYMQISNFMKIRLVGAELLNAAKRTDGHDEVNSRFLQFCEWV
jgi:hypothetical protein